MITIEPMRRALIRALADERGRVRLRGSAGARHLHAGAHRQAVGVERDAGHRRRRAHPRLRLRQGHLRTPPSFISNPPPPPPPPLLG